MTFNLIKSLALGVALVAGASGFLASLAQAQPIYRIVGPDGKITYADKPPPAADKARSSAGLGGAAGAGAATAGLPYELAQAASKYPVLLYTSENCVPCGSGRALLTNRGVPFTEKTVVSAEDSQSLQRLSGDTNLPFLTIGGQQIKGYSDAEWMQFLDAAGYPKTSVLPAGYRQVSASPLVSAVPAATAPGAGTGGRAGPRAPANPTPLPVPPADNPAGIRF